MLLHTRTHVLVTPPSRFEKAHITQPSRSNAITMTLSNAPWQLYIFSIVQLLASFFMYGFVYDPCKLITGGKDCRSGAETYTARAVAIGFAYVGLFFLVLTILNKDNAPKLKRLAHMAINCVTALFVGVMFTGSSSMNGVENSALHISDMFGIALLFVVMITAVLGDGPMEDSHSLRTGLGVNPKGFVLLVTIASVVKLFALNDFVDPTSFLADPDSSTKLSNVLWVWLSVCIFEIVLALAFTLVFGDSKDQEGITMATIVMMLVSVLSILPIATELKYGMMRTAWISFGISVALAVIALVLGRRAANSGYETVSNVV